MLNWINIEQTFKFEVKGHLTNTHSLFQFRDINFYYADVKETKLSQ
jgi:hypothetical protein